MRDFIWGNKGGIRLELDSCGIPLFCRKISLRVEADTFTSHKVRHSAASLKLSNTNDLKQRIFCKASIWNTYSFHKIWTLYAKWIKCSIGDMMMIAVGWSYLNICENDQKPLEDENVKALVMMMRRRIILLWWLRCCLHRRRTNGARSDGVWPRNTTIIITTLHTF